MLWRRLDPSDRIPSVVYAPACFDLMETSGVLTMLALYPSHPIAFAIIGIIAIEAGLLTPPFGLLVYTVQSSIQEFDPNMNVMTIFKSSTPYWIIMLIGMVVIINFPEIATYLPELLFNTG